jgi:hypothetical protein
MVILGSTPNENLSDPKEREKIPFYDPKTAAKNIQVLREEFAELYAKMVFTEAKVIWVDTKKRQALCEAHQSEAKDIQGMLDENKVKATASIVSGEIEGYAYQIKINGYKNLESNQRKEEVKKLTEVVKKLTSENIEFDEKEGLVKILPSKLNVKSIDVSILKLKKEQNDRNGFNYKEPPPEVIAQEFFSALNIASKGGEIKPIYLEVLKRVCKNNNIPLDLQVMESMISVTEKPGSKDVPKDDTKDNPLKDSLGKEKKVEDSSNLRRAEKEVLTNDIDAESQLGQKKKYSLNEKLLEYNNRVLGVESFLNTLEEQSKEASKSDFAVTHKMENSNKEKGSVSILSEANHHIDHAKNTQYLIEKIKSGAVTKDSVIALERKQDGVNLGMVDIIKIASILQHNEKNPDKQILIPDEIKKSEIYQDALLYKVATEHGISVIGVEGKKLDYNKESAHYNDARENHMVEIIDRLTSQGKKVILPVGSEHVENLQSKLGNKGIDAEIIAIEKTSEKRQEKQDSKPIIGKFTQMVSKDPSRMLVR